jgi:microcystin-dependent protein
MEGILGEIRAFAGNFAPVNWLICDGSQQSISTYNALFALIGTTYGGDGISTFALPDLRGRLAVGQGQGTGLTSRRIGENGGTVQATVTEATMPAHTHTVIVSTASDTSVPTPTADTYPGSTITSAGTATGYLPSSATGFTQKTLDPAVIRSTGASQPHSNVMPCLAVNYIICMNGVWPQRP